MHTDIIIANKPANPESPRVQELYPQYLREAATNVVSFLEEYYKFMNREGFPSYELNHIVVENDIDETSEKYLDAIQGEIAKIVPNSAVVDRNTLYKRIVEYYKIKGTPESIDIFFKIFFDSLAEIYYPNKDLFKLSDGDFSVETKYFVTSNIKYNVNNGYELLTNSGLSISPTRQPTLGDNFSIAFTTLLHQAQENVNSYFFTTNGETNESSFYRGKFDLRRDASGTFLWIKQDKSSAALPTIVRFAEDIFDDTWRNIKIDYSANSDDINLSKIDETNIVVSNSSYPSLNTTFTRTSSVLWESGPDVDFQIDKVTAFRERKVNTIIEGQEYEIADNDSGATIFTTYGAADNNVGTIFVANATSAAADTTNGLVKHRPKIWHAIDSGVIKYVENIIDDLHEGGITSGSNRIPSTATDDIIELKFLDYSSGESVQTANIKVYSDGKVIADEKISHNSGYINPTGNFSIFSYNQSRDVSTFDIRGRIAAFSVKQATQNNFDYRFTSLDASNINTLNDWTANSNSGLIQISKDIGVAPVLATGINENWFWDNDEDSYGPLPSSLHPLPNPSSYRDRSGFLSSEKKIQDSEFWQDFSYQISTETSPELWRESYARLVHPSGMKFFVLLLIELINRSRWDELISYISADENAESWYTAIIPPAKREINPSEGYHSPKYQPGWLSSAQRAIVIALAELQNNSEILDPYVNNFVFSAENSSRARVKLVNRNNKTGFSCSNNRDFNTRFSVIGFPLTRKIKSGEHIRFKFTATTGNSASPMVTLLHNKNDVGEQIFNVLKFRDAYASNNIDNSLFGIVSTGASPFAGAGTNNVSAIADNGVLTISGENNNPSQRYAITVRYGNNTGNVNSVGLEDGKSYTLTGECRVVNSGTLGTARAKVDISDFDGTFETTSETFVAFSLTTVNFPANPNTPVSGQFFDLSVNSGSSIGGVLNDGSISAEFRNIRLIENPEEAAVVRKFESGRCFDVTGGTLTTDKGHQIGAGLNSEEIDITLKSTSDLNQFIAFIDGSGVTGRTIDIEGLEIIDVDRGDYTSGEGADSLSLVSLADARYNRKKVFDREVDLGATLITRSIPFRDSYVFNDYINGEGEHNPRFWLDERSLSGTGFTGFNIDVFSLSYIDGIDSDQRQANISNPHEAYIKLVEIPIVITNGNFAQATIGDPFSFQITAEREASPTTDFEVVDIVNKPTWLTINTLTGEMSGTPPIGTPIGEINDFSFRIQGPDGLKSVGAFSFIINVVLTPITVVGATIGGISTPIVNNVLTIPGTVGSAIDTVVITTDEDLDATQSFELIGSNPEGIAIAKTGNKTLEITGIPYESHKGTYTNNNLISVNLKVISADGAENSDTELSFDFADASPIPSVTSSFDFQLLKDQSFTHTITTANEGVTLRTQNTALTGVGIDDEIANSFSIISGSLPPGLSLDAATGVISGTPASAGVYGSNNDGSEAGSSTPIKITHKWLGVQKLSESHPSSPNDYNFIVNDTVPLLRNIKSGGTVALSLDSVSNTNTTIYWGDDSTTIVSDNQITSKTYA